MRTPRPSPDRSPASTRTTSGVRRPRRLGVLLLVALAVAGWRILWYTPPPSTPRSPASAPSTHRAAAVTDTEVLRQFTALEAQEKALESGGLANEMDAQRHAAVIEDLWDALNRAVDPLEELLTRLGSARLQRESLGPEERLPHAISRWAGVVSAPLHDETLDRLRAWHAEGWRLTRSEWRHTRFVAPGSGGELARSDFAVRLNLVRTNSTRETRAQVSGTLAIQWRIAGTGPESLGLPPVPAELRWTALEMLSREGPAPFALAWQGEFQPFPRTTWIDPVILRRDAKSGVPEILLVARNLILRRNADGSYRAEPLSPHPPGLLFTALLADFTGDGADDLLLAVRSGLVLLRGTASGEFPDPAVPAWTAPTRLEYAQAFTTGDFDGDGRLDVFLGQYRVPYEGGQMPRPYFDALDGPPAYLLRNRGDGTFEDRTAGSGLEAKRHRRSYAASAVEIGGNPGLDLVITSDFAGTDVFENDGHGHFTDRTAAWLPDARGFGMSHAFAYFNGDGALDFLLVGMPQPTAERLDAAGWERPGFEAWKPERARLAAGNRLFFASKTGFQPAPLLTAAIRNAGWAWSAAVADYDQDGFPDVAMVNGHETRASVRDFEREFWTHDIYVGDSQPNPAVEAYFAAKFARVRAAGWSYGGYDQNRFFLNLAGTNWVEVGHLFGLALDADSRNAVAADFDGDGDTDLLVTTFEIWPQTRQTVRLYENRLPNSGHWIAFELPFGASTPAPEGATLQIEVQDAQGNRKQRQTWVTGDGYRSQALPLLRFGVGAATRVELAQIRWASGEQVEMRDLGVDRVHRVNAPTSSGAERPRPTH